MSRLSLIKMFKNEPAEIFNKCSKAYELGRKDERAKILEVIKKEMPHDICDGKEAIEEIEKILKEQK